MMEIAICDDTTAYAPEDICATVLTVKTSLDSVTAVKEAIKEALAVWEPRNQAVKDRIESLNSFNLGDLLDYLTDKELSSILEQNDIVIVGAKGWDVTDEWSLNENLR